MRLCVNEKRGGAPSSWGALIASLPWEPDSMTRTSIYSPEPGTEKEMDSPGRRVSTSMGKFLLHEMGWPQYQQSKLVSVSLF